MTVQYISKITDEQKKNKQNRITMIIDLEPEQIHCSTSLDSTQLTFLSSWGHDTIIAKLATV